MRRGQTIPDSNSLSSNLLTCQAEFLLTAETTVLLGFLGWDWVLVVISRMGSFPGAALTPLSVLTLTAGTNWSHFFTTYNVTILRD